MTDCHGVQYPFPENSIPKGIMLRHQRPKLGGISQNPKSSYFLPKFWKAVLPKAVFRILIGYFERRDIYGLCQLKYCLKVGNGLKLLNSYRRRWGKGAKFENLDKIKAHYLPQLHRVLFFSSTQVNITETRKVINTILIGLKHFKQEVWCYKLVKSDWKFGKNRRSYANSYS